jgi:hypothetical protein
MLCPARRLRAGSATKNVPYVIKLQNPKNMSTTTNKAPMNIPRISFNLAAPKNLCFYLPLTEEINLLQEMALRATTPRTSSGDQRCTLVHLLPVLMGLIYLAKARGLRKHPLLILWAPHLPYRFPSTARHDAVCGSSSSCRIVLPFPCCHALI